MVQEISFQPLSVLALGDSPATGTGTATAAAARDTTRPPHALEDNRGSLRGHGGGGAVSRAAAAVAVPVAVAGLSRKGKNDSG